jgi:cysteine-rich repeat protein
MTTRLLFALILLLIHACGDDGTPPDAGGDSGADADAGEEFDCRGIPDGTMCGDGLLCLNNLCVTSQCGDGLVHTDAGEECDDGNDLGGDGCEPGSCVFSCTDDAACDDGFSCNGVESCNTTLHRCQAATPEDGGDCTIPGGDEEGVCAGGECVPLGCGNSVVDSDEQCDDGRNGDNTDGCRDNCTFTCEDDAECSNLDECDGTETCDMSTHTCSPGPDLDCDDSDPCSADSCDGATGCINVLIDVDADGYAAPTCTAGSTFMGGDCDDANNTIHPGAPEMCDSIDNDCDGMTDEDVTSLTCYRDADSDGYGNRLATMSACMCPAGYITAPSTGPFDCRDSEPRAFPGQTSYFSSGWCPNPTMACLLPSSREYDFNCNGTEERQWTLVNRTSCSSIDCRSGWTGSTAPACGESASFRQCDLVIDTSGTRSCLVSVATRTQACR